MSITKVANKNFMGKNDCVVSNVLVHTAYLLFLNSATDYLLKPCQIDNTRIFQEKYYYIYAFHRSQCI